MFLTLIRYNKMCIDWQKPFNARLLYEYRNFGSHWKLLLTDFTENFNFIEICCLSIRPYNKETDKKYNKYDINYNNDDNDANNANNANNDNNNDNNNNDMNNNFYKSDISELSDISNYSYDNNYKKEESEEEYIKRMNKKSFIEKICLL